MKLFHPAALIIVGVAITIAILRVLLVRDGEAANSSAREEPGALEVVEQKGRAARVPADSLPAPTTNGLRTAEAPARESASPAGTGVVAARLRGRLLDRSTREPLPDFWIEIRGPTRPPIVLGEGGDQEKPSITFRFRSPPKRVERVATDREGRFASEGEFEAGTLELALLDEPDARRTFPDEPQCLEYDHSFVPGHLPPERDFEATIGPTYRIAVALPAGTDEEDFFATFPGDAAAGDRGFHRLAAQDPGSPFALFYGRAASHPEALEARALLRLGDPRWVRFRFPPVVSALLTPEGAFDLHLRSADGYWSGNARVTALRGRYPEIVRIELSQRGALEGRVHGPNEKAIASSWIELTDSEGLVRQQGADERGGFSFRWLPAGDYHVRVLTDQFVEWSQAVSVEATRTKELDVRLTSAVQLGRVSGVLRSRTGRHRTKAAMLMLKSNEDPDFFLIKTAMHRKRDGEYVAPFSFDDVPYGSYELRLDPLDNLRWNARRLTVSAPVEGLEFLCEDDVNTFDLGFRAVAATTGEPVAEFWTIVWQGDPAEYTRLEDDWESGLYEDVPEGVPLRWMVRAQGYRLSWGDEASLMTEGDARIAEVRLVPGWGQRFVVTTREREPVAGVELLVDGESVGRTDAHGWIQVDLDARPVTLEFRLEGWHVSWGSVDPAASDFGWGPETPVYLARDE